MWAWIGGAIVAVIVIAWIVAAMMSPQATPPPQATGPVPVYAPQGQITPNFPKGLILDSAAAISQSYSIAYASSTNLYTAIYDSSSTESGLFAVYKKYLSGNGWTITGTLTTTTTPALYAITATSAGGQVQVVVSKQGTGSHVSVGYTAK